MESRVGKKERVHVVYDKIGAVKVRPRERNWKPCAIKLPFLGAVALLCLTCIVFLEVMMRRSTPLDNSLLQVSEHMKRAAGMPASSATARRRAPSVAVLLIRTTSVLATPLSTESDVSSSKVTLASTDISPTSSPPNVVTVPDESSHSASYAYIVLRSEPEISTPEPAVSTSSTSEPPISTTGPDDSSSSTTTPFATTLAWSTSIGVVLEPGKTLFTTTPTVLTTSDNPQALSAKVTTTVSDSYDSPNSYESTVGFPFSTLQLGSTEVSQPRVTQILFTSKIAGSLVVLTSSSTVSNLPTTAAAPSVNHAQPLTLVSVLTSSNGQVITSTTVLEPSTLTAVSTARDGHVITSTMVFQPLAITSVYTASDGRITTSTMIFRPSAVTSVFTDKDGHLATSTMMYQPSTIVSVLTAANGQVTTSTTVIQPSATREMTQTSSASNSPQHPVGKKPDRFLAGDIKPLSYFVCLYVPSMIAVIIKEAWALIASGLKLMQPFYNLNKPDGATARESLMADYVSGTDSLYSIAGVLKGDMLMLGIVIVNVVMNLLAPLSTEAMTIVPTSVTYNAHGGQIFTDPIWVLNQLFVRMLQAVLSVTLFAIFLIAAIDYRRRSGLLANPSMTATMASLFNHPNMVHDLHQIDQSASNKEIESSIAHNRYKLTEFQDLHGNDQYGVVKVEEVTPQQMHMLSQDDVGGNSPRLAEPTSIGAQEHNRIKRSIGDQLADGLLMFLIVGLLAVIIAYYFDGSQSGFNLFFNSRQFGPRFILSLGASVTTTRFQSIEREVRLMIPYRRLAARNAPPTETILRPVNGTAVSCIVRSAVSGTWFALSIALVTVLGNILIIMVAGVPFSTSMTTESFNVCTWTSVTLAGSMLLAAIAVFFWRRQNKKMKISQEPNRSLIRVWMSLSNPGNRLRSLLNESEDKRGTSLEAHIIEDEGQYWAGWICDDYGRNMWCVDKEHTTLQSDYQSGVMSLGGATGRKTSYLQPRVHVSRRGDTAQEPPVFQREYREPYLSRKVHFQDDARPEQVYSLAQTHYGDEPIDHRRGSKRSHSATRTRDGGSDISDVGDIGEAWSHVETDYRQGESRSGSTEAVRLIQ